MNFSETKFYHYVPAATNPEGSGIFEMVQDDLKVASAAAKHLLGDTLYNKLVADQDDELSPLSLLIEATERFVCLSAFERAIPSLDLVLTPTGFGVVSNANVAPASADRVTRLIRQVRDMKECALDDLISELRGQEDWCETPQAHQYFKSLVWSGSQVRYFGYPNDFRTKLEELQPSIAEAESSLIELISPEFHAELTAAIRTDTETSMVTVIITLCQSYIYAYYSGKQTSINNCRGAILKFLDTSLEFFPTYAASSAYRANHFKPYENGEEDTCFFFG